MNKLFEYDGGNMYLETARYGDGNLAILLNHDVYGRYSTLSINVPVVSGMIGTDEFVLNHDLNLAMWDGLREQLLASPYFEDTGERVHYGMIAEQPVWRYTP